MRASLCLLCVFFCFTALAQATATSHVSKRGFFSKIWRKRKPAPEQVTLASTGDNEDRDTVGSGSVGAVTGAAFSTDASDDWVNVNAVDALDKAVALEEANEALKEADIAETNSEETSVTNLNEARLSATQADSVHSSLSKANFAKKPLTANQRAYNKKKKADQRRKKQKAIE